MVRRGGGVDSTKSARQARMNAVLRDAVAPPAPGSMMHELAKYVPQPYDFVGVHGNPSLNLGTYARQQLGLPPLAYDVGAFQMLGDGVPAAITELGGGGAQRALPPTQTLAIEDGLVEDAGPVVNEHRYVPFLFP